MNIPKLNIQQFLFSNDIWDIYHDLQNPKNDEKYALTD